MPSTHCPEHPAGRQEAFSPGELQLWGGPYKVLVQWTQESLRHWEPSPPVFLAQSTLPLALATLSSLGLK